MKGFEVTVVTCPRAFVREVQMVFPGQDLANLIAIPTCQKSVRDLCEMGEDIEKEKDALLESFDRFSRKLCAVLRKEGEWSDFIDPCSGLPALREHTNRGYSEVDGLALLLRFSTHSAGMCKVASHPKWGTSFYPATIFTTAPIDTLRDAIKMSSSSS